MNRLVESLIAKLPPASVYPVGLVEPITPRLKGRSFFPGGSGLFEGASQPIPHRPVMLVGQDYGTAAYWRALHGNEESVDGTWSGLCRMLAAVRLDPRRCFFTNLLLGVRVSGDIEGPSPGLSSPPYVDACIDFWREQVRSVQPSVVVTLGAVPTVLLNRSLGRGALSLRMTAKAAPSWKEIDAAIEPFTPRVKLDDAPPFALASSVHPVRYWLNAPRRSWPVRGLEGQESHYAVWAEIVAALSELN